MTIKIILSLALWMLSFGIQPDNFPNDPENILCRNTWKLFELVTRLDGEQNQYYIRGGKTNTAYTTHWDSDSLKFFKDHSGKAYFMGQEFHTNWRFTPPNKLRLIVFMADTVSKSVIDYEIHELSVNYFKYSRNPVDTVSFKYQESIVRIPN
jgi:hypothetical protein